MSNRDILIETVQIYNDYIKRVAKSCLTIVELLRKEQTMDGFNLICEFTEGLQWVQEVNTLFVRNNIKGYLDIEIINNELKEINNALKHKDYILVGDIFEYEIEPFIRAYSGIEVKLNGLES